MKTVTTIDTGVSGNKVPLNDMLLAMYELDPSTLTAQDKKNVMCAASSLLESLSDDISGIGHEACSLLLGAKNLTTDAYLSVLPNEQEQAQRSSDAYETLRSAAWNVECLSTEYSVFSNEKRAKLRAISDELSALVPGLSARRAA